MNQSASEFKLTTKYIQMIHDLKIVFAKSLTSVANSQINKIIREVGKKSNRYQVLPVIRSQITHNPKKVKSIQFSKPLAGYEQDMFREKLPTCIRSRVRQELVRIKKKHTAEGTLVTAIKNIVACFSGSQPLIVQRDPWPAIPT